MCTWEQFDEFFGEEEEYVNISLTASTSFSVQLDNTIDDSNDEDVIFLYLSCGEPIITLSKSLGKSGPNTL